MTLIFSAPAVPPSVPAYAFYPIDYEWVAWNGDTYTFSDWEKGIWLDTRGVEGLHFPVITKHTSTSRAIHGNIPRGWRAEPREVFWPLQIWGEASDEWLARYRAFFDTIDPEKAGTWRVGVDGVFRELQLTGRFDDSHPYELDPVFEAWGQYGVTLEASQPFWAGAPVTRGPWRAAAPVPFFGENGAPPFHISGSATFTSASIPNPGRVETYPVWLLEGPLNAGATVGVGTQLIEVPFPVGDGETLRLDTDPRNVTATLDGADVSAALGFQPLAPVPPGEEVALNVAAVGAGSISVELTPLYFHAF